MAPEATTAVTPVEDLVNAYESVRAREPVPIAAFLPGREDPRFLSALAELVRVEMEYAWADGRPRRLPAYRADYPELFADPSVLGPVAFEEYRLRRQAGEAVARDEYARDYGIDTSRWPEESGSVNELSQKLAEAETLFPEVGQTVAGFRLERELGRGAFGRVYLARQGDLADRPVALKVAADVGAESRALARLQHTNVMPVYSVHRAAPFQAVCMPFFPAVTLADLCRSLARRDTVPESGQALLDTLKARTALAGQPAGSDPAHPEPPAPPVKANLDLLAGVSFVQAVVWIGANLADGLAHAHERGIVHRDLKPANILLTDEGQPLILDFNLAADISPTAEQARAALGGTLPYMPPEHLQAFRDRRPFRDPRGDVYALGLILFELLAGRHPFPIRRGAPDRLLPDMIADRQTAPSVREFNRAVPRGVEAILGKCLDPDPARRYPTGRELHEDLQRQFDDEPLRYAREPVREQLGKWRRRHPRLTSWATVGGITLALLLTAGLAVRVARHERELAVTRDKAERFHVDFEVAHIRAAFPTRPGWPTADAPNLMWQFKDRWPAVFEADLGAPPWTEALEPGELARLRREVGDTYYLMADERKRPDGEMSPDDWRAILALNDRARAAYPPEELPRALAIQRAEAHRKLGEAGRADLEENVHAANTPVKPGHDQLWTARELTKAADGRRRQDALPLLRAAALVDPSDPLIQSYLGYVYLTSRRPEKAIEHYGLAIGLYPLRVPPGGPGDQPGADRRAPAVMYFARGLAYHEAGRYADAERDFGAAIERRPDLLDAYVNRALMREHQGNSRDALADLDHVLAREPGRTDVWFQRARVRGLAAGHLPAVAGGLALAGSIADEAAGLRSTPTTARGWVSRSRRQTDLARAAADLDEALRAEPDSEDALQHLAELWSERLPAAAALFLPAAHRLGQHKAIEALDALLNRWPEYTRGRAARAVLLARAGRDPAALADAEAVLRERPDGPAPEPLSVYQVAGAYALVSQRQPAYKAKALSVLAEAFRRAPGLISLVNADRELDPLREDPDFRRVQGAAAIFRTWAR